MLKPQTNISRQLVSLDGFWAFRRDPEGSGEASGWPCGFAPECELAVPGNWNEQRTELAHFFGLGWYSREFVAPAEWAGSGVLLHIGSAQNHARVWLNGEAVGSHRGGCLPFVCRLEKHLRIGRRNLLVVEVDTSVNPWDLPPARIEANATHEGFHNSNPAVTYDFFPYGGISRSVCLQVTPTTSRLDSIRIDSSVDLSRRTAVVDVEVLVEGPSGAEVRVQIEKQDKLAEPAAAGGNVARFELDEIRLWDLGAPELYTLTTTLTREGRVIDTYEQTFGLRRIEVTADSFKLNGRPVQLTGFGKHEDFPVMGRGLALPVIVRDFDLLRWIGANSFRTSHYPYAEEWYEFADRHGILVIGETPLVGLCQRLFESKEVLDRALEVLGEMIARDRHHPSVVVWSVANEPWIESPEGVSFVRRLLARARELDPTRPVTYAAHMDPANNEPCEDCDIVCVNKYCGWYEMPGDILGGTARLGTILDAFRSAFGKPILFSEFGADAIPGVHTLPAVMFSEEFQAEIVEAQILEARRRPWVIGVHVWAFADFKTAQSITRAVFNHKGVFTRDRTPKLAAHALRALWSNPAPRDGP